MPKPKISWWQKLLPLLTTRSRQRDPEHGIKLFIDTNIFLHFPPLEQLGLKDLLKGQSTTVVLPSVTLQELDRVKLEHKNQKTRERADRAIRELIRAVESDGTLKGGILVEQFYGYPKAQLEEGAFDPDWRDDVLLASIIAYREKHQNVRVILLTRDGALGLKATHHGLETIKLDEALVLPPELSETELELRETKAQLRQYESAIPSLNLALSIRELASDSVLERIRQPAHDDIDEDVKNRVERMRSKYPLYETPQPGQVYLEPLLGYQGPSISGMERYNAELVKYFAEYETYVRSLLAAGRRLELTIRVCIEIENTGFCPAENVEVRLYIPRHLFAFTHESSPEIVSEPSPPAKPGNHVEGLLRQFKAPEIRFDDLALSGINHHAGMSIESSGNDGAVCHQVFPRIQHGGSTLELDDVFIEFPSFEKVDPFQIAYDLIADNVPKRITGKLNVVVRKATE